MLTFPALVAAYLDSIKVKPSHGRLVRIARQWVLTLPTVPTRAQLLMRQRELCAGHFKPNATKANKELALVRTACRWGQYEGVWTAGDPTAGIRKFKTPKRKRIGVHQELRSLLEWFDMPTSETDLRDRALYGMALFTGCRPGEIRTAQLSDLAPYGTMGRWTKPATKTGEPQYLPVPPQAMRWMEAWLTVRRDAKSPYLFPGQRRGPVGFDGPIPLSDTSVRTRWGLLRRELRMTGLWHYDLRRTLATYLHEMGYSIKHVKAILNHYEGDAIDHYVDIPFDSLAKVIVHYEQWLLSLRIPGVVEPPVPMLSFHRRASDERGTYAPHS